MTICGSGNAGHALAVALSANVDGDVDWLVARGSEERAALLRSRAFGGGLNSTGVIKGHAKGLRTISADPSEVIPGADLVLIVVPAFAHATVLKRIAPHVSDKTTIGCLPTRGGFEFEASRLGPGNNRRRRTIFGLQTLPWSARVVTMGEVVNFGAEKSRVVLAALPATAAGNLAQKLSKMLGLQIVSTDSFLNLTLGNPGQFIHPGLMFGHFRSWDGEEYDEERIPMFYAHATDEMGEVVERLSLEAVTVARAIEEQSDSALKLGDVVPVHDWLRSTYSHVTGDPTTVATCFRTGPLQIRKAPVVESRPGRFVPSFDYRYLTEDVPYGLVITRGFAELAGVPTPTIDEVILWAQPKLKKAYLVGERLEGEDAQDLPLPQNHGVGTIPALVDWYGDEARPAAAAG